MTGRVLHDSAREIVRDTDVQRSVSLTRHDVDVEVPTHG